jgi:MarR family transcriptional regulator, organic hydroperoxide resistance regulator
MDGKARGAKKGRALTEDDFWPIVIEFTLSQRAWWVGLCAEFDLTAMQGHALRTLDPERPVAMSTLADALVCDASNVTGIVDKLESRSLIARQGADHDRRIKMLAVTDKGRRLREQLCARTLEPPAAVQALSADARRRLAEVLRAIVIERGGDDPGRMRERADSQPIEPSVR